MFSTVHTATVVEDSESFGDGAVRVIIGNGLGMEACGLTSLQALAAPFFLYNSFSNFHNTFMRYFSLINTFIKGNIKYIFYNLAMHNSVGQHKKINYIITFLFVNFKCKNKLI